MRKIAIAVGLFSALALATSKGVVITFDPAPLPGGGKLVPGPYIQNGVRFDDSYLAIYDGGLEGRPDNGSAYLADPLGTVISFVNHSLFNFTQIDVAEYSSVFASPQFVQLLGHKADNSTVGFDFYTDGVFDGTGPLADFQTVVLPASFTGLRSVEFGFIGVPAGAIAIDNVNLAAIPEPSLVLFLAAGCALYWVSGAASERWATGAR